MAQVEGREKLNYYDHHIGDYDSATAHLSWVEDAAYRRLISLYYRTERPIPADISNTCRLVRAQARDQRAAVEAVLQEFFELRADGWHQQRCDTEIAAYQASEPEREARKTNETLRLARHREERAALFGRLNAAGQHATWNASIAQLREMVKRLEGQTGNGPATPETPKPATPATAPETPPATGTATPATATHLPPPTSHLPPPSKRLEPKAIAVAIPDWVPPDLWLTFVEHRKAMGKKLTPAAANLNIAMLEKLRGQGCDIAEVIRTTVRSGWQTFYAPKQERANGSGGMSKQEALEAKNRATADAWAPPESRKDVDHAAD